jgi:hypothetical protein
MGALFLIVMPVASLVQFMMLGKATLFLFGWHQDISTAFVLGTVYLSLFVLVRIFTPRAGYALAQFFCYGLAALMAIGVFFDPRVTPSGWNVLGSGLGGLAIGAAANWVNPLGVLDAVSDAAAAWKERHPPRRAWRPPPREAGASPEPEGPAAPAESAASPQTPWEVLGVPRTASPENIQEAYRGLMRQYHPDRVAHLGPELRALAEEMTKKINCAYDSLR